MSPMRIETLLQDKAVRDAMAGFAFAWAHQHEDAERGAETVEQTRAHAVTALLAALAGEGENLDAAVEVATEVWLNDEGRSVDDSARKMVEAAAPFLTAPLLARVATLEAENAERQDRLNRLYALEAEREGRLSTVEAERDRLKTVVEQVAQLPGFTNTGAKWRSAIEQARTLLGETGR